MGELAQGKYANWIQLAILLVTLLVLAVHGEGRLARVEQRLDDSEKDRAEMIRRLTSIEDKIGQWRPSPN